MNQPSGRHMALAATVLAAGLGAIWLFTRPAHADHPSARPAAPAQVTAVTVQPQPLPVYRVGVGTVTAAQSVTVKPRIDGQLERVAFTEGQDVQSGQLLLQIDPRTLEAQLAQARAQKARDEAQLANARADLQRYTTLLAQDAATRQQLDTQAALVAQLSAAVQTDAAQVNAAQVQLGFTRITAPISGRVGARLVDPGNIVHAADANGLVVINQIDPIALVFTLPEDAVPDILKAQQASHEPLAVVAYPRNGDQALATGHLVLLNNQIDTSTGTVQLKAVFTNPAHALWPGQYVNVRLVLGRREQALAVPAGAVQRSQAGAYVYVVSDDHTVRSQAISVARLQEGLAVVDKGLAAGDRVVVDGQYKLKPGVHVVEAAPPSAAAASVAAAAVGSAS